MLLVRTWHLWFSLPTFFIFSSASLILDFNIADPSTILMYNVSFTTANCRRESVPLYSSNNWRFSSFFCYEKSLFRFYAFFEKPVFVLLIIFSFQAWLLHLCSALFRSPHIYVGPFPFSLFLSCIYDSVFVACNGPIICIHLDSHALLNVNICLFFF